MAHIPNHILMGYKGIDEYDAILTDQIKKEIMTCLRCIKTYEKSLYLAKREGIDLSIKLYMACLQSEKEKLEILLNLYPELGV